MFLCIVLGYITRNSHQNRVLLCDKKDTGYYWERRVSRHRNEGGEKILTVILGPKKRKMRWWERVISTDVTLSHERFISTDRRSGRIIEERKTAILWTFSMNGQRQADKKTFEFCRLRSTELKWFLEVGIYLPKLGLEKKKT